VVRDNNLLVDDKSNIESVCDACQKGKMHQLPYSSSSSVSHSPLELVFQMYGVLPLNQWAYSNIMYLLLMILANSHGST
jgi:hypothetical protein